MQEFTEVIEKGRKVQELMNIPLFKKVLIDGFVIDGTMQFAEALAYEDEKGREEIMKQIEARSIFSRYLKEIIEEANHAIELLEREQINE
jgi:hypothetical protein